MILECSDEIQRNSRVNKAIKNCLLGAGSLKYSEYESSHSHPPLEEMLEFSQGVAAAHSLGRPLNSWEVSMSDEPPGALCKEQSQGWKEQRTKSLFFPL